MALNLLNIERQKFIVKSLGYWLIWRIYHRQCCLQHINMCEILAVYYRFIVLCSGSVILLWQLLSKGCRGSLVGSVLDVGSILTRDSGL